MNRLGIRSIARRRKLVAKMSQLETYHRYENVLNRDFTATRPNQKWVTDITFITTQQGWAYLSTIKDLFGGFIVAYQMSLSNSVALVTSTLRLAKENEKVTDGLILHSDQGHQYTSHAYHVLTQQYSITPSMSRRGNCWDNAPMENFFGHLKEEALRHVKNPSFEEAKQLVDEYIHFFNYERIQLKTRQTPYQIRCLSSWFLVLSFSVYPKGFTSHNERVFFIQLQPDIKPKAGCRTRSALSCSWHVRTRPVRPHSSGSCCRAFV